MEARVEWGCVNSGADSLMDRGVLVHRVKFVLVNSLLPLKNLRKSAQSVDHRFLPPRLRRTLE
jgi:hypothetical protein